METNHIADVVPFIDQDTWLLVDLDNCMFESSQPVGHAHWFYDTLQQKMQKGMSRDQAIAEIYPDWVKAQNICQVQPLEEAFVPTLVTLQQQGITIMGLTHRQTVIAETTVRQVGSLGFDFSLTAPYKETFVVPSKHPTIYMQGILFVSDYNKKIDIFEPFLAMINQCPKKVVFLDDKKSNVEELKALTKSGIEYVGVHYTAIDRVKPIYRT